MKTYYIQTDSGSQQLEARNVKAALLEWGEAPKWVTTTAQWAKWLTRIGGFGRIEEDGVTLVEVEA